jgi:hypothetical protein
MDTIMKTQILSKTETVEFGGNHYEINFHAKFGTSISRRKIGSPKIPPSTWVLTTNIVGGLEFRHSMKIDSLDSPKKYDNFDNAINILEQISKGDLKVPTISNENNDISEKFLN